MAMAARQRDGAGGGTSGGGPRSRSPDGDRGSSSASDSATGSEEEALEGYRKGKTTESGQPFTINLEQKFQFVCVIGSACLQLQRGGGTGGLLQRWS